MLRILQWILFGHAHEWETVRTCKTFRKVGDEMPIAIEYHMQCKHCGNMKVKII